MCEYTSHVFRQLIALRACAVSSQLVKAQVPGTKVVQNRERARKGRPIAVATTACSQWDDLHFPARHPFVCPSGTFSVMLNDEYIIELVSMPRPFKKLRATDIEELAESVVLALNGKKKSKAATKRKAEEAKKAAPASKKAKAAPKKAKAASKKGTTKKAKAKAAPAVGTRRSSRLRK